MIMQRQFAQTRNLSLAGKPAKAARIFFESWLNNNMAILMMMAQSPRKTGGREKQTERMHCFLESIERHFGLEKRAVFTSAIRFLKQYLKDYPAVSFSDSEKALAMIRHLYLAMGLETGRSRIQKEEVS